MTKPLTVFLQLVGFGLLMYGLSIMGNQIEATGSFTSGHGWAGSGLILVITGRIANRMRRTRVRLD